MDQQHADPNAQKKHPEEKKHPKKKRYQKVRKIEHDIITIRPLKLLWQTIKVMRADQIVVGWIILLIASVFFFRWYNPVEFPTMQDSAWYVFETVSTIGYGDFVATTGGGRIVTVLIGFSSLFVLAILTGVVVNYYTQRMQLAQNESFIAFGHKMEHVTEMTPDELAQLQEDFKEFMRKRRLK
jgi:voltage-gated potassium channel